MRTLAVIVLLALVAAAAAWALFTEQNAPPPSLAGGAASRSAAHPLAPSEQERSSVPAALPKAPQKAAAADAKATPPVPSAAPLAATSVTLDVRDLSNGRAVPSFRWRFRSQGADQRGEGHDGRVALALPIAARGDVLVEADAFAPFVQKDLTVPPADDHLVVDVRLVPAVLTAGITLLVHDVALQPLPHVRVDAFPLDDQNRDGTWQLGKPLWARRADATDGRYVLPPLPVGEFGIRVVATDADGELLPLLPYVRTFALTGGNGFLEDVPLEAGALPELELVDQAGQPLDPDRIGLVTVSLRIPGGPEAPRRWVHKDGPQTTTAIDTLPGRGVIWPAEALPAGAYTLEVRVAGETRLQRLLALRAGERQAERLVVP